MVGEAKARGRGPSGCGVTVRALKCWPPGVFHQPQARRTTGRGRLELLALAAQESEGLPLAHLAMRSGF